MLRKTVVCTLAVALLATPVTAGPAVATPQPARSDIGVVLHELLEAEHAGGVPGVFAQVRDRNRTWNLAAGVADLDTGRPVRPQFRHRIGSITKTFVATTVLQLVGERRVRLDAPIAYYLPHVVPGEQGRQITVRMLLNHTSGLGDYDDVLLSLNDPESAERLRFRTLTPRQLISIGLSQPPTNPPGQRWSYSNTNYIILGVLIQRLTGHPYATEVTRRILRPLRLTHTYFPGTDPSISGPHSLGYVPWPDGTLRDFSVFNMSWAGAAGEMISTMGDLNRFYRALLTGRLLRPDLLAQMKTTVPFDAAAPQAGGYGLGISWGPTSCGRAWGHDGGVIGYRTQSFHSADGHRQVSVAQNIAYVSLPQADAAHMAFVDTALCGRQAATPAAPAAPRSLAAVLTETR